jgi:hypothetical protein
MCRTGQAWRDIGAAGFGLLRFLSAAFGMDAAETGWLVLTELLREATRTRRAGNKESQQSKACGACLPLGSMI